MSAFLVEDKTIHKIINILDFQIRKSPWLKNKFREELGINFEDYNNDWKTNLGQKMWDLNQLSLGYRYGDEKQELVYRFWPSGSNGEISGAKGYVVAEVLVY